VGQHVAGKKGVFNVDLVERKTMSAVEFRSLADALGGGEEPEGRNIVLQLTGSVLVLTAWAGWEGSEDPEEIERKFWKSLRPTMDAPVYGADIVVGVC
jgi:hypothetical protein